MDDAAAPFFEGPALEAEPAAKSPVPAPKASTSSSLASPRTSSRW